MLTAALDGLVARFGLEGERLGEVAAGAVLKHSRDFNLTRECVLGSRLAPETPAYDVQQACGTGLEAVILVANKIALGQIDAGDRGRRGHHLRRADRAQRGPARGAARGQSREVARPDAGARARPGCARTRSCPRSRATRSRAPGCRWASTRRSPPPSGASRARSRTSWPPPATSNLAAAYERGFNDDLVTPYLGLERDQNLRADTSTGEAREAQAGLRRRAAAR